MPFRNKPAGPADFPESFLQPDTGMTQGGLPFVSTQAIYPPPQPTTGVFLRDCLELQGSTTFTPELLQAVRASLDAARLQISTLLVLNSGCESIDPVQVQKQSPPQLAGMSLR